MDQLGSEQSPLEVIASKFPGTFDGIILTWNQGILSCYIISVWVHSIFLECMKWCNDGCLAMGKGTTKLWNLSSFSFTCCLALVIGKSWGFQLHSIESGIFVWLLTALLSSCKTWNIGISFDVWCKKNQNEVYVRSYRKQNKKKKLVADQYLICCTAGHHEEEYRCQLGRYGVVGDLALRPVRSLSGGQKSRVVMALMSMVR